MRFMPTGAQIKCRFDGVMAQELAPAGPMGGSAGSPEGDGDEEWEQGRDVGNMPRVPIPPGLYCTLDENKKINLRVRVKALRFGAFRLPHLRSSAPDALGSR